LLIRARAHPGAATMLAMSFEQPQGYAPAPSQPSVPGGAAQHPQGLAPSPDQQQRLQGPQSFGGAPTGELVVNLQKPFGAMGMISPVLTIDGFPATASWGRNSFPAPVGVRQVEVASNYLWTYGRASMPVTVEQGRTSEVYYNGPMWTIGMGGRMGTEPQPRPGKGLFIGLMVFIAAVFLLSMLLVLVSTV
jgi:hypothetical protein